MADTTQLIAAHAVKLKKLLARHKAGKKLSAEELRLISPDGGEGGEGQTSYDSMQAAAAALDIPKGTLQWAKDQGAPGFKGSRVYPLLLLPWLEKRRSEKSPIKDKRALECDWLTERIEQLREERARARGEWILWADVQTWQRNLAESLKLILQGKLKNELPPKLEGLRAPEMAAKMDGVIAELVELIRGPV